MLIVSRVLRITMTKDCTVEMVTCRRIRVRRRRAGVVDVFGFIVVFAVVVSWGQRNFLAPNWKGNK